MKSIELNIEDCTEDSVLAEDVTNTSGAIMLKAGTVLTEDKISSLSRIGVTEISIVNDQKLTPEQIEKKRKEVEKRMSKLFRKVESDVVMQKFKSIMIDFFVCKV